MTQPKRSWLRRIFKRKHGILPIHRRSRVLLSEQLEQRQLLAADLEGDVMATARPLTLVPHERLEINATIGDGDYGGADVDFFKIDMVAGQEITIDVDAQRHDDGSPGSSLDGYLTIFRSNGDVDIEVDHLYPYVYAAGEPHYNGTQNYYYYDPYLKFTATYTDSYYIAVSDSYNSGFDPNDPNTRDEFGNTGSYTLQLLDDGEPGYDAPVITPFTVEDVEVGQTREHLVKAHDLQVTTETVQYSLDSAAVALGMTITAESHTDVNGEDVTYGRFSWTPTAAQGAGVYSVTVRTTDNSTVAAYSEFTFNVTVTGSSNTPPAGADNTKTTAEDTNHSFVSSEFGFSDSDGDSFFAVTITTLPPSTEGTLKLSGVPVNAGQSIPVAEIQMVPPTYRCPRRDRILNRRDANFQQYSACEGHRR